jgi:acetyl/propionyl-CoA carboxylase alpha subunit
VFTKVLVANRGEIAVRVCRTLREMGIASVAVYSEADRELPFVEYADEAYAIGPGPAAESYIRGETIIRTAQRSGAEAIHPGFGFLAENPAFARACAAAGLTFIGPSPDAMEAMASKTAARQVMAAAGVPIVPGVTEPIATLDEARAAAAKIGYPGAVAAGGGVKWIKTADLTTRAGVRAGPARGQALPPTTLSTWSAISSGCGTPRRCRRPRK